MIIYRVAVALVLAIFDFVNLMPVVGILTGSPSDLEVVKKAEDTLHSLGIPCEVVLKVHEGRPHGLDLIVNGEVQLLVNTPLGKHAQRDDYTLRQGAIAHGVPYTTTLSAASAACDAAELSRPAAAADDAAQLAAPTLMASSSEGLAK